MPSSFLTDFLQFITAIAMFYIKKTPGRLQGVLVGEDGNGHELARQEIPYTDFPLPEGITLFKVGNVLMLPSEY